MKNLAQPPHTNNPQNQPRRVGVELEFIGLSAATAAELVADVFGGDPTAESKYRYMVNTPKYGEFMVELDTIYAHDNNKIYNEYAKRLDIAQELAQLVGDVSRDFVPMEIVGPPLAWTTLEKFDEMVVTLREKGAKGTMAAPYYAFGCQLNAEIAAPTVEHILPILQAFLIMEPWLRQKSNKDLTRKISGFADPFPKAYQAKVLSPDYAPSLEELIEDYIKANPTRNRALDMLPLFKYLKPELVEALEDERIQARPAYHYRLPDCPLGDTSWKVSDEWNRWVKVEQLANNPEELRDRAAIHLKNLNRPWIQKCRDWVKEKLAS